jgi:hypothetical protein
LKGTDSSRSVFSFFFAAREFLSSQRTDPTIFISSRPKIFPPLRTPARLSPFSDSPLKSRIVRQLSRPSSRVVQAIAKRFAAACAEVGPGEVGDAAHIDAVRRAFNAYDYDPWGEPVRRRPRSPEVFGRRVRYVSGNRPCWGPGVRGDHARRGGPRRAAQPPPLLPVAQG